MALHRRTRRERSTGRQVRPWCGHDLRTAPTTIALADQARAQRLLLDLAGRGDEETEVCGITVTGRIAFDAVAELVTRSRYHRGARFLTTTTETPEATAAALADTLPVLGATSPEQAGQHLQSLAPPTSPHAPVTVAAALAPPSKNPLLGVLQLDRHRHAMTAASQLVFRTTAAHAQYPLQDGHSPASRRALQLPEHRPDRPRPTPAWIPQTLWPGALPGLGEHPIDRAEAALLLAQMGSTRSRAVLTVELGLPSTVQPTITARARSRRADGTWPQLLTDLEHLLERLRAHPPWVDYRNRRLIADDLPLLDRALTTTHPGPTSLEVRRRFWELFTGGDALFAPDPLAVTAEGHLHWAGQRDHVDADHAEHFDAAFELLDRSSPLRLGRPLVWHPP